MPPDRVVLPLEHSMARAAVTHTESSRIVYVALIGNILVAISKFVAAGMTGSSAMLSEGIHSLVDITNELLLLYGLRRGSRKPDEEHPLGYGREIYFWSFVVALLIFTAGAGASIYEGITHILRPRPIENAHITYIVLGLAALFEGVSWVYTVRTFGQGKKYSEIFSLIVRSKDPPAFIVLLEDSAALLGIFVAFLGVYFSVRLDAPVLDGFASLCIGAILAVTAMLLARETKGLLIGEAADRSTRRSIWKIAEKMPGIVNVNGVLTVHVSPNNIVAALSIKFDDDLRIAELEPIVVKLERAIKHRHPEVSSVSLMPETAEQHRHGW